MGIECQSWAIKNKPEINFDLWHTHKPEGASRTA